MSSMTFNSLRDLHNSANDLLRSPIIQQALLHHKQDQKWVQKVSESSLRMLDSCGTTKDLLVLVKDHIQQLQFTFRRVSVGKTRVAEKKLSSYHDHRKDLKKGMLNRCKSLKRMRKITTTSNIPIDHNLMVVVNVLSDVKETIISLLESLMLLMSMPSPRPNWKPGKGVFGTKGKFTQANSLSLWEKCDGNTLRRAIERLEAVESAMEDLEIELECIFKRLIRTRVLLLNILTN